MAPSSRSVGDLTSPEVAQRLRETSILCLPMGAIEQHGEHLPLNTDVIVAEELTRRIIARWGEELDLWQLPTVSIGLSREHDWAPGTLSLTIQSFVALLRDMARDLVRALPARNLAIVNGHGGNRGVLENLIRDFAADFGLNACVIHPFDLSKAEARADEPGSGRVSPARSRASSDALCAGTIESPRWPLASLASAANADVHGGKSETSVMLALAPQLVRCDMIAPASSPPDTEGIAALIFDRGVSFPWRTDDPRLAKSGVIGDAHAASPEFGQAIVDSVVAETGGVLRRLLENQRLLGLRRPRG
jgi:creatinine amidohydrolase